MAPVPLALGAAAETLSPPLSILHPDKALAQSANAATRNSVRLMCAFLSPTEEICGENARARVNKPLSIFGHKEIKTR